MTKVRIEPGACGFTTRVTAEASEEDEQEVTVRVVTGCKAVKGMMESLGNPLDAYSVCLAKPGKGPLFAYASENFPVHAGCPVIAGITKCVEAECGLALRHNAEIVFEAPDSVS